MRQRLKEYALTVCLFVFLLLAAAFTWLRARL
jgi:hypothetical protein